jgi:tRNA (mo5U34)-methyltransferase
LQTPSSRDFINSELILFIKGVSSLDISRYISVEDLSQLACHRLAGLDSVQVMKWMGALKLLQGRSSKASYHDAFYDDALHVLGPWRKGPFTVYECGIDSEWDCRLKWQRLLTANVSFSNQKILDIGCGNGYFMFELSHHQPQCVIGIDPTIQFLMQFCAVQQYYQSQEQFQDQFQNIAMFPMGYQDLGLLKVSFDLILCMGVLYHHRDPQWLLKRLWDFLPDGGVLVLETLILNTECKETLFPKKRYANMRNVYEVPSISQLTGQLQSAQFSDIRVVDITTTTSEEQRVTEWSSPRSLRDFLDPQDGAQTIEGYPAPVRAMVVCHK